MVQKRDSVSQAEVFAYIKEHPSCDKHDIAFALHVYPYVVDSIIELLVGSGSIRKEYGCLRPYK